MIEVILTVNKDLVYYEVAKTTGYAGAKISPEAYNRMYTTEADREMLERFWGESKSAVCNGLKDMLGGESEDSSGLWMLNLSLSNAFDRTLILSMQDSLFSFFVMAITAKWYAFVNKDETAGYASEASSYMEDMMRKAYHKKKPMRPTYRR